MTFEFRTDRVIGLLLAAFLLCATSAAAADEKCAALAGLKLKNANITIAEWVVPTSGLPAELSDLPGKPNALNTSAITLSKPFCRVAATIEPTAVSNIKIEVWLPALEKWNGKYLGTGNGGAAGQMWYQVLASGLDRGYATAHTDMGTSTPDGSSTFDFGIGEPNKVVDWSYRSTHLMTLNAKKIVSAYYRQSANYHYFYGCSTGGHQALAEAQKYPEDYDGIVSYAPAHNRTNLHMSFLWVSNAYHQNPLSPAQTVALNQAVIRACDGIDGIVDDVLDDPRRCQFDPQQLLCRGEEKDDCLAQSQVEALKKIYAGPSDPSTGESIYPGLTPGSEAGWLWWEKPYHEMWGNNGGVLAWSKSIRWTNDGVDFDFHKDAKQLNQDLASIVNYTDPDLTQFRQRGGKLLLIHGWVDNLIPAQDSIDYYERVENQVGSRQATREFTRLFTAPGVAHCAGGPGPNRFDVLTALEGWVEKQAAPERITATKFKNDNAAQGVDRTRPLCSYPKVARWNGTGNILDAANFECMLP